MINLLVAPPATGKTRACLDLAAAGAAESQLSEKWIIVPDQIQADSVRTRFSSTGKVFSVRIATFQDLSRHVLEASGDLLPTADPFMLRRFLQEALSQLHEAGQIPFYASVCNLPGFGNEILERIAELKRSLVSPEKLAEIARAEADPALIDMATIYRAYQDRLLRYGWMDPEGVGESAIEVLNGDHRLLTELSLLIIDGFDDFTAAQLQLLKIAAERAADTWVTLPGTPAMNRMAHHRSGRTVQALKDVQSLKIHTLSCSPYLPPALQKLEENIFEYSANPTQTGSDLLCIEAPSQKEETREALRWLKALILRENVAASDCAIAVPDLTAYRPLVESAACEFGIPVYFTQGAFLSDTPFYTAITDMLSLIVDDYPFRLLLDTIRSPYFDLAGVGLSRADARLLEITGRYGQIVEGFAQWQETLQELSAMKPESGEVQDRSEGESFIPRLPQGEIAKNLKEGLSQLNVLLSPSEDEMSSRNWTIWLRNLLESLGFFDCLAAAGETRVCAVIDSLLVTFGNVGIVTEARTIPYDVFLKEWKEFLAASAVQSEGSMSETPAVRVLSMTEARSIRTEALVIMGLSETVYPVITRTDPFISEEIRSKLGMETSLGKDQANLFYQLLTRSNRYLLLTRPYLARDGESWEPSSYWNSVQELLLNEPLRRHPDEARAFAEAASAEELLFWSARRWSQTGLGLPEPLSRFVLPRWQHIKETQTILSNRLLATAAGSYNGDLSELAPVLQQRFDENVVWSASRFESYAGCPFLFLASSVLGLELIEPPKAGYMANQLGSILHEVLEKVYCEAPDPMDVEAVLKRLPMVAGQVFDAAPKRFQFRVSPLWEVQKDELLMVLKETIQCLADIQSEQAWRPHAFEARFGLGGEPPLIINTTAGKIRVHGVIDRIDINQEGQLCVIDYKSGGSNLSARDLNDGRRLQLPIYALAARDALSLGEPVEGFYWKLLKNEPGALKLSTFKNENGAGPEEAFSMAAGHIAEIVAKIRSGSFYPVPPQGGCPGYCAAASWCWYYKEVKY